jgi:hypothetical protein
MRLYACLLSCFSPAHHSVVVQLASYVDAVAQLERMCYEEVMAPPTPQQWKYICIPQQPILPPPAKQEPSDKELRLEKKLQAATAAHRRVCPVSLALLGVISSCRFRMIEKDMTATEEMMNTYAQRMSKESRALQVKLSLAEENNKKLLQELEATKEILRGDFFKTDQNIEAASKRSTQCRPSRDGAKHRPNGGRGETGQNKNVPDRFAQMEKDVKDRKAKLKATLTSQKAEVDRDLRELEASGGRH